MHRINRHRHIIRPEQRLQRGENLLGQAFLYLWALGEELHNAVNLRQTNNRIFRNIRHRRFAIDSDKVVFAGAGQRNIADRDHLVHLHFIFNDGDFREVGVIETGENLIDIHFRNAMRSFHQTVIAQIEIEQLHNLGHMARDKTFACFVIHLLHGRAQRGFETTRNQRFMNQSRFFTE